MELGTYSTNINVSVTAYQNSNDEVGREIDNEDEVELDHSGVNRFLPLILRRHFAETNLEKLYLAHQRRQRQDARILFSICVCSLNICALTLIILETSVFGSAEIAILVILSATVVVLTIYGLVAVFVTSMNQVGFALVSSLLWALSVLNLCLYLVLRQQPISFNIGLAWLYIVVYITFLILPFQLRWSFIISLAASVSFILTVIIKCWAQNYDIFALVNQVLAAIFLIIGATGLGIVCYIILDQRHRRAFLQTKGSLSLKVKLEEESKVRERLLLSVLPQHVATNMLTDWGQRNDTQFRKIYMSRHENVSILFADIVGFTALSSTCSAPELVKLLNQLFANFDKLAQKYDQLRIKILGDCYYCISGAPNPRPDHAVMCIYMGLGMVEEIGHIRERTKSNVNMRVGIHTGAVLGGVLGQKQWQFDVLGKEVTLANKMESGGIPGRVHISETTEKCLNGQFDLEPGEGETREDAIKQAGIKTYLVKSVRIPFGGNTARHGSMSRKEDMKKKRRSTTDDSSKFIRRLSDPLRTFSRASTERQVSSDKEEMYRKLHQALTDQEEFSTFLSKVNVVTFRFHDHETEQSFSQSSGNQLGPATLSCILVLVSALIASLCLMASTVLLWVSYMSAILILCTMAAISVATSFKQVYRKYLVRVCEGIERSLSARTIWLLVTLFVPFLALLLSVVSCDLNITHSSNETSSPSLGACLCDYPSLYCHVVVLIMLLTAVYVNISYLLRSAIAIVIGAVFSVFINIPYRELYDRRDQMWFEMYGHTGSTWSSAMTDVFWLIAVAICLVFINRHEEKVVRKLFLWRLDVERQKSEVSNMRLKNESLLYNLLPAHVAVEFMKGCRTDEELYSSSYDCVGVMFAACPNFNSFYTEDAANNNGLECLRLLNEIISDYDELLDETRFRSVIKIKTVGSTYMAASGMNDDAHSSSKDTRMDHLRDLVEFALAMRNILDKINAQSFNNFILKIGINHGPVVAGVIGARKPHYDIWGNAVNVASRMESTGTAGKIQVVEETKDILVEYGYDFEKRGLVKVKGKGELMTYFLQGSPHPYEQNGCQHPNHVTAMR